MGLMTAGQCKACGRSGPIPGANYPWCYHCAEDPVYRRKCERSAILTVFIWLIVSLIYILIIYECAK